MRDEEKGCVGSKKQSRPRTLPDALELPPAPPQPQLLFIFFPSATPFTVVLPCPSSLEASVPLSTASVGIAAFALDNRS